MFISDGVDGSSRAWAHFHRLPRVFGFHDLSQSEFRIGLFAETKVVKIFLIKHYLKRKSRDLKKDNHGN